MANVCGFISDKFNFRIFRSMKNNIIKEGLIAEKAMNQALQKAKASERSPKQQPRPKASIVSKRI